MSDVEPRKLKGNMVDIKKFREWKERSKEIPEKTQEEEKGADNVYAFPIRDDETLCPKCGTAIRREKCPGCGIPLKNIARLRRVVPFFGKQMILNAKVCPTCGEPTDGDVCAMCEEDVFLV